MRKITIKTIGEKVVTILDNIHDFRVDQYLKDIGYLDSENEYRDGNGYLIVTDIGKNCIVARVLDSTKNKPEFVVINMDDLVEDDPFWLLIEVTKDEVLINNI